MFAKLNISINEVRKFINAFDWSTVRQRDIDSYFDSEKDASKKILDVALLKNNIWDGDGVREMNFPRQIGTRHIFISHSHDDIEDVKKLAYVIEQEFEVNCFIDSMVWQNMNDLIRAFDEVYSLSDDNRSRYSYKKRNYSTSHVHTMLATALLEMINDCECFLFIGSKNSTLKLNYFKDHSDATLSPWIYEENTFVKYIKPIIPEWLLPRRRLNMFSGGIGRVEERRLNIAYKLDMSTFHTISADLLLDLEEEELSENDFLYRLYEFSGVLQQIEPLLD